LSYKPMTHDEIDTLPAGRELDALVAEKVMRMAVTWVEFLDAYRWKDENGREYEKGDPGYVVLGKAPVEIMEEEQILYSEYDGEPHVRLNTIPHYSTDIAAAWEVVGWLLANGHHLEIEDGWSCVILTANICGTGETAPEAICRAALEVVADA